MAGPELRLTLARTIDMDRAVALIKEVPVGRTSFMDGIMVTAGPRQYSGRDNY
jgi:hypothetical protein